ncbi:predicted protein [Paecilomyces variotii No. 5]|uniref:Uncharacterized protein n=1 Tax=Byssochlamys spectabilis (strain No. 5 / NBRC 109023) TaxID=1356009 RepID=V5FX08_BYSSN|nr:predicted protein [Paecilomyces variotii No. 5]
MAPSTITTRALPIMKTALRQASSHTKAAHPAPLRRASIATARAYHSSHKTAATRPPHGLQSTSSAVSSWRQESITPSRGFAELTASSGRSEADLLVGELEELYEAAKDEFEIATDSVESGTIYAPSDRAAARDALNHLTRIYTLYTEMGVSSAPGVHTDHNTQSDVKEETLGGEIAPNYDPESIPVEVREEVKRRVGQRIRELQSAVDALEEKAQDH